MRIGLVCHIKKWFLPTFVGIFVIHIILWTQVSWLKTNSYSDIEETDFVCGPHVLKVLLHYIPKKDRVKVLNDFPKIWLYRDDKKRQFLSHVARLRTNVHHAYKEEERPQIQDNSLIATRKEF